MAEELSVGQGCVARGSIILLTPGTMTTGEVYKLLDGEPPIFAVMESSGVLRIYAQDGPDDVSGVRGSAKIFARIRGEEPTFSKEAIIRVYGHGEDPFLHPNFGHDLLADEDTGKTK